MRINERNREVVLEGGRAKFPDEIGLLSVLSTLSEREFLDLALIEDFECDKTRRISVPSP